MVIPLSNRQCLYTHGRLEAERYQRRLRLTAGDDPAARQDAITEWNRLHWWTWAAERYLEHISGEVCWEQFGDAHFDILGQLGVTVDSRCSGPAEAWALMDMLEGSLRSHEGQSRCELASELERRIEGLEPPRT